MPDSREFDVRYIADLALPYDVSTKELSDGPHRLVGGNNTIITPGGKIAQAPGLNDTNLTSFNIAARVDRLVVYETVEDVPKVYLLISVYTGTWGVYYLRIDGPSPGWTSVGTLRSVSASLAPHEFIVARGLCFIKSFGAAERYGTVIFNGSGVSPTLTSWGLEGPNGFIQYAGNFGVVTANVLFGWRYTYAYVNSATGHVSNRSGASDITGSFVNSAPRIQMIYSTDPTVTHVNVYRTMDGGGTFYFLEQIANVTSGGTFYYNDVSAGGNPVSDFDLDIFNIAPSDISNYFPPSQIRFGDLGSLYKLTSPPAYFARRIWFALGNRLYYSGQEEILNGVPEESFPGAFNLRGNYYIVQGQIRQLKAAKRALYVNTSNEVMILTGQDKTNFLLDTLVPDIAAPAEHPHAITSYRDSIFFMSSDLQIYGVTGQAAPILISTPLGSQLRTAVNSGNTDVQLEIFARDGNTWLIVNVADSITPANTRQFVYDLARDIWFTPWTKKISAMAFGHIRDFDQQRHLIVMTWDGTISRLAFLDTSHLTDVGANFTPSFTANLVTVPSGNHINELRKWAHAPMLSYFITERTKFTSDTEPTITYRLDEFSGSSVTATAFDPPFSVQRASYFEKWYPIQKVCKRVQLTVTGTGGEEFAIQNLGFVFQSEAGA